MHKESSESRGTGRVCAVARPRGELPPQVEAVARQSPYGASTGEKTAFILEPRSWLPALLSACVGLELDEPNRTNRVYAPVAGGSLCSIAG